MQLKPAVDLSPYFVHLTDLVVPFSWNDYFGNDHPVEFDVGCGRGQFLLNSAQENPQINYVGIEIDFREGRRSAERLKKRELENARVWGGDARIAFEQFVPVDSVSAIHVYFPDPWWKKRHRRRRVFTDLFVDSAARVLEPEGLLNSRTDVPEYFEVISALMHHDTRFSEVPLSDESLPADLIDYQTSFERKALQAGSKICKGIWRRNSY